MYSITCACACTYPGGGEICTHNNYITSVFSHGSRKYINFVHVFCKSNTLHTRTCICIAISQTMYNALQYYYVYFLTTITCRQHCVNLWAYSVYIYITRTMSYVYNHRYLFACELSISNGSDLSLPGLYQRESCGLLPGRLLQSKHLLI